MLKSLTCLIKNTFNKATVTVNLTVAFVVFASLFTISCGNKYTPAEEKNLKTLSCKSSEKNFSYDEIVYTGKKGGTHLNYSDIRDGLASSCTNCHGAPSNAGGFTFIDAYQGEVKTIAGVTQFYPGYYDIAEKALTYLNLPDENLRMPPKDRRDKNPALFIKLAKQIDSWIQSGKPKGPFDLTGVVNSNSTENKPPQTRNSDVGDCTPSEKIVGTDYKIDRMFANINELPKDLSETDLFSLDAFDLARKGTLAYNVEYPLWADNNNKGRWVHVPVAKTLLGYEKQSIKYNPTTLQFEIPDNTRFYKTFYKKVNQINGKMRYRRVETRIIVVRTPWDKSLFGTYKWDDTEESATLVDTPYRDGTGFKDILFKVVVDDAKQTLRDYAIPGKQRCLDCHMGSEGQNAVLGFTPLQINRRQLGEYEKLNLISDAEQTQVQRFIDYNLITNMPEKNLWPRLETMNSTPPQNIYEYRASGYMTGNCAHCHNANGLAFTKENGVQLELRPGSNFGFNTKQHSVEIPSRLIVHQNGDLDQSQVWRKVSDSTAQLGLTSQMPMNTPGTPDCNALRSIGKWVRSFESLAAAEQWEPACKKENAFAWIDQDFTIADDPANYIPKRPDWKDPVNGMSQKFRDLAVTPELENSFLKKYAIGYWSRKDECQFPDRTLTADQVRPWMLRGDKPKRPFGEIYETTPGAWFFRTSCLKCHGPEANGDSSLARAILMWSGGSVRVANFKDGMFGNKNANIEKFLDQGKNYAPNYLVWMAMEGTRVQFPAELSSFLGKHGGQMLNQMRDKCINQISPAKPSSPQFIDHEVFNKICFVNNLSKEDPSLAFDPNTGLAVNPAAVEIWADRAAYNVGFSIYNFLFQKSAGEINPGNDQCEIVYPKVK